MSIGLTEQIERLFKNRSGYVKNGDTKFIKKAKHKKERQRAKKDLECQPCYRKYSGWQY